MFESPILFPYDYYLRLDSDSRILATPRSDPIAAVHAAGAVYAFRRSSTDDLEVTRGLWAFADDYLHQNVTVTDSPAPDPDPTATAFDPRFDVSPNPLPANATRALELLTGYEGVHSGAGSSIVMSARQYDAALSALPDGGRAAYDTSRVPTLSNNFEILSLPFFRRADVRHWTRAADESYGIYRARWGDSPLRYLTLRLFLPPPIPPPTDPAPAHARVMVVTDQALAYEHGLIRGNIIVHVLGYGFCYSSYHAVWLGWLLLCAAVTCGGLAAVSQWCPVMLGWRWYCSLLANWRFWVGLLAVIVVVLLVIHGLVQHYGQEHVYEVVDAFFRF